MRPKSSDFNLCIKAYDIVCLAVLRPCLACGRLTMNSGSWARLGVRIKEGLRAQGIQTRQSWGLCARCYSRKIRGSKFEEMDRKP